MKRLTSFLRECWASARPAPLRHPPPVRTAEYHAHIGLPVRVRSHFRVFSVFRGKSAPPTPSAFCLLPSAFCLQPARTALTKAVARRVSSRPIGFLQNLGRHQARTDAQGRAAGLEKVRHVLHVHPACRHYAKVGQRGEEVLDVLRPELVGGKNLDKVRAGFLGQLASVGV